MKKVLIVFGTRPEAIKMAPVIKEFQKYPEKFETVVCVTAQHREMLDQVLSIFEIKPDIDLNLMQTGQDLTDLTTRVLTGISIVLKEAKPDIVLVHGDTTTSTVTALAAFYQKIPVGHVEAGLRTHNIYSPWPEEMNRQLTGRLATWHFAPTRHSKRNLLNEGVAAERIIVTGNTVIDALRFALERIKSGKGIFEDIEENLLLSGLPKSVLQSWDSVNGKRRMILITGHRRENFGEGFRNICEAIRDLSIMHQDTDFVFPMHLNPNVRKPIIEVLGLAGDNKRNNIYLIEPLEYLPFVYLMGKCYLILTDSGGIQEEAPGLGKPVLVLRDTTERPEAIDVGSVKLIGTNKQLIIMFTTQLLSDNLYYSSMGKAKNPYGDGNASKRIINYLLG